MDYLDRLMDVYGDGPDSVNARVLKNYKESVAREMLHRGLTDDPHAGENTLYCPLACMNANSSCQHTSATGG